MVPKLEFKTLQGGLKAVLWTDALQAVVMMGALFSLAICGVIEVGGFGVAWERSADTERTKFFKLVHALLKIIDICKQIDISREQYR